MIDKKLCFSQYSQLHHYLNRQDANQISYKNYVDNERYSIYVRFWEYIIYLKYNIGIRTRCLSTALPLK